MYRTVPMIQSHSPAPSFSLPGTEGETISRYRLGDLLDTGPTVLAFYPFDFSPVSTEQLCTLQELEWLTTGADVDVVGISPDSAYCHKQFATQYDLRFPLLCDRLGTVAQDYEIPRDEYKDHQAIPKRAIVTIDESGSVRSTWEAETPYQAPSVDNIKTTIEWYHNR